MHFVHRLGMAAALAFAVSNPAHAKNETDLSAFQGAFFGKAKVTVEPDTFRGRTRIRGRFAEDGLSGTISIEANVRVEGDRVPIDNRFLLQPSGRVVVRDLAPAVSDAKVDGNYSAKRREINFQGSFDVENVKGTFTCNIRINREKVVRATYSVTIGDDTSPSFVYKFVAKPKK